MPTRKDANRGATATKPRARKDSGTGGLRADGRRADSAAHARRLKLEGVPRAAGTGESAAGIVGAIQGASRGHAAEHSEDVVLLANAICDRLEVEGTELDDVLAAARLHDIGKAAVPVEILDRPGPLSEPEWALIREHTLVAEEVLSTVAELEGVAAIVRHSHERWDGGGYPDGLRGEQIPLGSRIIFCADAFDAIRSDRPYRPGRSAAAALEEVRRCSGTQFDPRVVAALEQAVKGLGILGGGWWRRRRVATLLAVLAVGITGTALAGTGALSNLGSVISLGGDAARGGVPSRLGGPFGLGWPAGGGACLGDCEEARGAADSTSSSSAAPVAAPAAPGADAIAPRDTAGSPGSPGDLTGTVKGSPGDAPGGGGSGGPREEIPPPDDGSGGEGGPGGHGGPGSGDGVAAGRGDDGAAAADDPAPVDEVEAGDDGRWQPRGEGSRRGDRSSASRVRFFRG